MASKHKVHVSRLEKIEWIGWERSSRDRAGRERGKEESCRALEGITGQFHHFQKCQIPKITAKVRYSGGANASGGVVQFGNGWPWQAQSQGTSCGKQVLFPVETVELGDISPNRRRMERVGPVRPGRDG